MISEGSNGFDPPVSENIHHSSWTLDANLNLHLHLHTKKTQVKDPVSTSTAFESAIIRLYSWCSCNPKLSFTKIGRSWALRTITNYRYCDIKLYVTWDPNIFAGTDHESLTTVPQGTGPSETNPCKARWRGCPCMIRCHFACFHLIFKIEKPQKTIINCPPFVFLLKEIIKKYTYEP